MRREDSLLRRFFVICHTVITCAVSSADQFTYTQDQARNITTGTTYASLIAALLAAQAGEEIRAYDAQFDGTFSLSTVLVLRGGFARPSW